MLPRRTPWIRKLPCSNSTDLACSRLAYRMLGTPGDAEDVLHYAWLRWHDQETNALDDPEAWLVTVTTRLALDRLRRAKTERAPYPVPGYPSQCLPKPTSLRHNWSAPKA